MKPLPVYSQRSLKDSKGFGLALVLLLAAALLTAGVAWFLVAQPPRLPFSDLRWTDGYPHVFVDSEWFKLISIDGLPIENLVEAAVQLWGPAYQDQFAAGLADVMRLRGLRPGLTSQMTLVSDGTGRQRMARVWNSSAKWRHYVAATAARERVSRETTNPLPQSLAYIVRRIDGRSGADNWLSADKARADLNRLEWLLINRYAYLESSAVDYKAALDWIASDLGDGIGKRDFALQIARALALFRDGHTEAELGESGIRFPPGELPCLLESLEDRVICLSRDARGFFDPAHPFLRSINGESVDRLASLAAEILPNTSSESHRRRAVQLLRHAGLLAALLGRSMNDDARAKSVHLGLESPDRSSRVTRFVDLVMREPRKSYEPPIQSRILPGGLGYLAMRVNLFPGDAFQQEIVRAMQTLRDTRGLILDLRGNSGGRRDVLPVLLAYFVPAFQMPKVLNIAAVRMDPGIRPPEPIDLLRNRHLYAQESTQWTPSERAYVQTFLRSFQPAMKLRKDLYSDWHLMLLRVSSRPDTYFYAGPVVVLQDDLSASATEILLSALKDLPRVTLLGVKSSGGSGYPVVYRLPHSGIVVRISSMVSFQPDGSPYNGTEPDVRHERTLSERRRELEESSDALLDAATKVLLNPRSWSWHRKSSTTAGETPEAAGGTKDKTYASSSTRGHTARIP